MPDTKMVKMETGGLEGPPLAYCVAKAVGYEVADRLRGFPLLRSWVARSGDRVVGSFGEYGFRPDKKWEQGGPIVSEHVSSLARVYVAHADGSEWVAGARSEWGDMCVGFGSTALIAAMRAVVASKFGREVEVPEILVEH